MAEDGALPLPSHVPRGTRLFPPALRVVCIGTSFLIPELSHQELEIGRHLFQGLG